VVRTESAESAGAVALVVLVGAVASAIAYGMRLAGESAANRQWQHEHFTCEMQLISCKEINGVFR